MTRASLRYLSGHRLQTVLSVLGVALGVAVVLAIDVSIESSRAGFRISAETVAGRTTHVVTSESGALPDSIVGVLRRDFGVRAAAPVVEGFATSPSIPGRGLRVLGVDPLSEFPFRPWVAGGSNDLSVTAFLTTPRAVMLPAGLARTAGVESGDELPVSISGESWELNVAGVVEADDELTRAGLSDVLLMDIAGAQEVLRAVGEVSRIDLLLPDDGSEERLRGRLADRFGSTLVLQPVGTRSETLSGMIGAFDVNLTALSLLALIFGMFLIYNAVTFSVVQRQPILGRLRAMGVTRKEIVALVLREAVWIGVIGAAIGVGAGIVLSRGLVRMVSRTINDLYFSVSVQSVSIEPMLVAKAALLGLLATVVAAIPPALEAAGANPRLAALRSMAESRVKALVPRAALFGGVAMMGGVALLFLPTRSLVVSFTALFLIISGMAVGTPAGTLVIVATLRPILRRLAGTPGVLAARGVGNSLSRTAPAIAALVVAVSVTVGLGVMIQSFRGSLTQWLDGTLQADIYVSLPGSSASQATGTIWPEVIDDFVAHPDVEGHSTYRGFDVVRESDVFRLVALDLDPRGEAAFQLVEGRRADAMAGFREGLGVIVSEPYAYRRGVGAGDGVEVTGDTGTRSLEILGVFRDYGSEQGTVMMGRVLYDQIFDDDGVTSLGLFLREGADSERVVEELIATLPPGRTVIARTNDTLRRVSLEVFDRTFRVTAVLRLLAFIVAFVGVLSALAALQLERARELGMLRALGMTPGQLWGVVVGQTGLIGLAAGLLAVPMGLVLAVVMVFVVNKRSFGWTLDFLVTPGILGQAVALALVAALLAGLYPARRMASSSPALALRGE